MDPTQANADLAPRLLSASLIAASMATIELDSTKLQQQKKAMAEQQQEHYGAA